MANAWVSLLGSPRALSLRAWLAVTPVGVIAAPLAAVHGVANVDDAVHWMLIGLLAQVPMGVVMLFGGLVVARMRWPRATTTLVLLLAGAVRGLVVALVGQAPDVATRTVASAVTMTIWLLVIGAALESHDRYRAEVDGLLASLVARELHGRLLDDAAIGAARSSSAQRVAETSRELRVIVDGAADDHARTAAMLQAAIETRLRPLSHDLWFSPTPSPPRTHPRRHLVGRIMTADVPVVPLLVLALILLAWGSVVLHGVWLGALVGIAVALAYGGTLWIANAMHAYPRAAAACRYAGVLVLPALAGEAMIGILGLGQRLSPIAVALGLPLITFGVAMAITLSADRARTIQDLQARLAQPDWDRHLGELVRRRVDEQTASKLHNSVQPVLTATALQLRLASALDDPQRAREALMRAMHAIDDVVTQPHSPSRGRRRLDEAADAWRGIADVDVRFAASDVTADECELLADVVHESVANAVRHGGATVIGFEIRATDDGVTVTMTDDGSGAGVGATPGLGTTWLRSVALSVESSAGPDGRRTSRLLLPRSAGGGL